MSVKNFTIPVFLLLVAACGRDAEVHSYTEVNQLPPASGEEEANVPEGMQAGPLNVAPLPENRPPDHPTLQGGGSDGKAVPGPRSGAGAGAMAGSMQGREREVPPPPSSPDVDWEVPEGWEALPASGMRVASFRPEGAGESGMATLIVLGPNAGSLENNVLRWRGQVDLPAEHVHDHIPVEGEMPYTLVNLVTESAAQGLPTSIIGAIYELPNRTMFLKFTGDTDFLVEHKTGFLRLAQSISVEEESR